MRWSDGHLSSVEGSEFGKRTSSVVLDMDSESGRTKGEALVLGRETIVV